MRSGQSHRRAGRARYTLLVAGLALALALIAAPAQAVPLPGAIFTTDSACSGVNVNIFASKGDVYLDGGPAHPNAAGLPDGAYYVRVTTPSGDLLGTSVGAGDEKPFVVTNGEGNCVQLSNVLIKASDASQGYDNTTNPGGEYKVWASKDATFPNDGSKTDNFKAPEDGVVPPQEDEPHLLVQKFYDANANGVKDGLEGFITGWKINIHDGLNIDRFTPVDVILAADDYVVTEYLPVQPNWFLTTGNNPANVTLALNVDQTVTFGNVCTGAGGGLTLGFWSNKNGQALVTAPDLGLLTGLNLKNANGSNFDPATNTALKNWLLSGSATNMAYMLSVQLAAMELNVFNGNVSPTALIYAPATLSANAAGFATVQAVMDEANTDLGLAGHNITTSGTPGAVFRADQEELKNALDNANNNKTFAQSQPCAFSF
jgi:hypothetical protein